MNNANRKILVVIGGGAAGFFCAVNAARLHTNLQVIMVEKTGKLLSKVRVSGGGRCNVTHACFSTAALVKRYPRGEKILKKAFNIFNTTHTIEWFEKRGVKLKTEDDGRMFPVTNNSQTIIDCLMQEAEKNHVEILLHHDVRSLEKVGEKWLLRFANEKIITADFVCIASGGYPKTLMFDWLTNIGFSINTPVPSLFTFNMPGNDVTKLMGVSVTNAQVKIVGSKLLESGPLLITHWGMSGPAILKLSAWGARELADRNYHFTLLVNWLPDYNEQSLREEWHNVRNAHAAQKTGNKNPFQLPQRLWLFILSNSGILENIRWADLPGKEQNKLIKNLTAQEFEVKGKTTFKEEFVTCGGILTSEVDANTMQSKRAPNLFFAGEVLDVDGVTGGFNFQHAWTSGFIAACAIVEKAKAIC